jgi:inosine-uridine nucleoside N-ribohydrolase
MQRLAAASRPLTGVAVQLLNGLGKFGPDGVAMHDPPALGEVIHCGLIRTREMWGDVVTRGEFTRGTTVAAPVRDLIRSGTCPPHIRNHCSFPESIRGRAQVLSREGDGRDRRPRNQFRNL